VADAGPSRAAPILLVEDNFDDIVLTRRAFRKAGIDAPLTVLEDGEQAVAYLGGGAPFEDRAAHPLPALILLDWKLPRRNGLEVLTWLRARDELATVPVVVLTSSKQEEDVQQAYRAGANSYLQKPVRFDAMIELVQRLHLYWLQTNHPSAGQR